MELALICLIGFFAALAVLVDFASTVLSFLSDLAFMSCLGVALFLLVRRLRGGRRQLVERVAQLTRINQQLRARVRELHGLVEALAPGTYSKEEMAE